MSVGLSVVAVFDAAAQPCRVLVVVGMEDERAIAAGEEVDVVVGAANADLLRRRLDSVDVAATSAVYSFGVAGGLDPALAPGDLLLAAAVIEQAGDGGGGSATLRQSDSLLLATVRDRAAGVESVVLRTARFLGTSTEARDNDLDELARLHEVHGVAVVDNESHIAAGFAAEHGLPFVAVRVVSDSVYKALPPAALLPLDEDGSPDGLALLKSMLLEPSQIPALVRTARDYMAALEALRAFREAVGFPAPGGCGQNQLRTAAL